MTNQDLLVAVPLAALVLYVVYWIGCQVGMHRQQDLWRDHMERGNRYIYAVDDLDRWCGHQSPHARLIARHLKALGDGTGHNAGTPTGVEACDVSGLRQQLDTLDKARAAASGAAQGDDHAD